MRKLVIAVLALLVPATLAISAPPAQAAVTPIDVTVSPASGPAGSILTVSGECGDGQNTSDRWLVTLSGEVGGVSLGDPAVAFADAAGGAFSEQVQALSDTDPDVPTAGDTIDISVDCESYQGLVATGTATFGITESADCPSEAPEWNGKAADGFSNEFPPATYEGGDFVPGSPVIVCLYSTPQLVGAATADAEGQVSISLTADDIPHLGEHLFAVIGYDIDTGDQVVLTSDFYAYGEALDPIITSEPIPAPLPNTGMPPALRLQGLLAGVLLVLGCVMVVVTRRRRGARHG